VTNVAVGFAFASWFSLAGLAACFWGLAVAADRPSRMWQVAAIKMSLLLLLTMLLLLLLLSGHAKTQR